MGGGPTSEAGRQGGEIGDGGQERLMEGGRGAETTNERWAVYFLKAIPPGMANW